MKALLLGAALAALATAGPAAGPAPREDDDLAAVRQALGRQAPAPAAESGRPSAAASSRPSPAERRGEPRWLRVRVVEKPSGHERVSVRLPLRLAHLLGDEVDWDCPEPGARQQRCSLSRILEALEGGEDLVQIDSEDARVRVWVE